MKLTIKFTAAVEYITSRLQELENYGHRPSRIVQDWVVLCHALLAVFSQMSLFGGGL